MIQGAEAPAAADGLRIRPIQADEFERAWPIFREVVVAGDSYDYPADLSMEQARAMWTTPPVQCYLAEDGDQVLGLYGLRPNPSAPGERVANAGYMVAAHARRRGVASAMCVHSLDEARRLGFTAMQFNYVVSTNDVAVRLWQRHGFAIVDRVPGAFDHATLGPTDVFVMRRAL